MVIGNSYIDLYILKPVLPTLIIFQGHSSTRRTEYFVSVAALCRKKNCISVTQKQTKRWLSVSWVEKKLSFVAFSACSDIKLTACVRQTDKKNSHRSKQNKEVPNLITRKDVQSVRLQCTYATCRAEVSLNFNHTGVWICARVAKRSCFFMPTGDCGV